MYFPKCYLCYYWQSPMYWSKYHYPSVDNFLCTGQNTITPVLASPYILVKMPLH
uniref:Uncharacterized protein n=1 Tax=Octopus bimaculoides TaxID=37653 RepID=A0A0L8HGU9_OCTBM